MSFPCMLLSLLNAVQVLQTLLYFYIQSKPVSCNDDFAHTLDICSTLAEAYRRDRLDVKNQSITK